MVEHILDDESTEYLDVKTISGDTIPSYMEAIKSLEKAVIFAPSKSIYHKALSDIYAKLGMWAEAMENMNAPLPAEALSSKKAFEAATGYLKTAINLEPTNPDYHLALGQFYDMSNGNISLAEKELAKALAAYPVNAPLRYAVARQHLLMGRKGDALEQARILANIDDGYIIPESIEKKLMAERRTSYYLSRLSGSYLFKALEIAWRVSKDPEVVKGIAPDNPDAKEVLELFLEWKGIEG
ncbi:MAG: hypothetical protein HY265_09190 [Deltaproteobacteria bacterium]|nr:hypothetical protein [Deltaproteobacteria bacterium]